jgi:hypothetical protein
MFTEPIRGELEQVGEPSSHAWGVIKTLAFGEPEASRLLELYYWTREPGMLELIRAFLDLPERTQRGLSDFLLNIKPQTIVSSIDQQGRLVLSQSDTQAGGRRRPGG